MSPILFSIGRTCVKHARVVLVLWIVITFAAAGGAWALGGKLNNDFQLPGTEAQAGLEQIEERFPEFSGTTAQVVITTTDGTPIADHRPAVAAILDQVRAVPNVDQVLDPFAELLRVKPISKDGTAALSQANFTFSLEDINPEAVRQLEAVTSPDPSVSVAVGGQLFTVTEVPITVMELVGVALALLVLLITFRSLAAALTPIICAAFGVGLAMALIYIAAAFMPISTTTPTLAVMLGLAVGIDYSLFIVYRHREQLSAGMGIHESIAKAVATSGSAVIFAGSTVIIALFGLAVAKIPFLTVMGIAAAVAVGAAVAVSVTALPALLTLWGKRLQPRTSHRPMRSRWVRFTTAHPLPVIGVVIVIAALCFVPATQLRLALPDNGTEHVGTTGRDTYDLVAQKFGPGANAPLLVIGDIVSSTDPLGLMSKWAEEVGAIPGVSEVSLATPNRNADLGVIVVQPTGGQAEVVTENLVHRLRELAPTWENELQIENIRVTGMAAAAIDISNRLTAALIPFGIVVVGLSLVLLILVFRSIAIGIKATLGYLVSIAAAFGASAAVFNLGYGAQYLGIAKPGAVISFMPIIVMGVLFGLAMDYEVFLVSRMREEYVHTGRTRRAIIDGYDATAPVVIAAALIMIAVFSGFVPEGSYYVQPIALGLAVGVFVDAFIVRMSFVPAVMSLLGRATWWLPAWLDKRLPHLDVEGTSLDRKLSFEEFEALTGPVLVRFDTDPVRIIEPGSCLELRGPQTLVWQAINAIRGVGPAPIRISVAGYDTVDEPGLAQSRTALLDPNPSLDRQVREIKRLADRGRAIVVFVVAGASPDPRVMSAVEQAGGATIYYGAQPHREPLIWEVSE